MSTDPTSSKAPGNNQASFFILLFCIALLISLNICLIFFEDDIRAKSRCLSVHLVEGLGNFVEQDNAHQNNISKNHLLHIC